MVRIRVTFKKPVYRQPDMIYPVNFFVDLKNDKLELRAISLEDARKLFFSMLETEQEKTRVKEKSSYGGGIDVIIPLEFVESILTFTNK